MFLRNVGVYTAPESRNRNVAFSLLVLLQIFGDFAIGKADKAFLPQ
jgi:hypothetical protein